MSVRKTDLEETRRVAQTNNPTEEAMRRQPQIGLPPGVNAAPPGFYPYPMPPGSDTGYGYWLPMPQPQQMMYYAPHAAGHAPPYAHAVPLRFPPPSTANSVSTITPDSSMENPREENYDRIDELTKRLSEVSEGSQKLRALLDDEIEKNEKAEELNRRYEQRQKEMEEEAIATQEKLATEKMRAAEAEELGKKLQREVLKRLSAAEAARDKAVLETAKTSMDSKRKAKEFNESLAQKEETAAKLTIDLRECTEENTRYKERISLLEKKLRLERDQLKVEQERTANVQEQVVELKYELSEERGYTEKVETERNELKRQLIDLHGPATGSSHLPMRLTQLDEQEEELEESEESIQTRVSRIDGVVNVSDDEEERREAAAPVAPLFRSALKKKNEDKKTPLKRKNNAVEKRDNNKEEEPSAKKSKGERKTTGKRKKEERGLQKMTDFYRNKRDSVDSDEEDELNDSTDAVLCEVTDKDVSTELIERFEADKNEEEKQRGYSRSVILERLAMLEMEEQGEELEDNEEPMQAYRVSRSVVGESDDEEEMSETSGPVAPKSAHMKWNEDKKTPLKRKNNAVERRDNNNDEEPSAKKSVLPIPRSKGGERKGGAQGRRR